MMTLAASFSFQVLQIRGFITSAFPAAAWRAAYAPFTTLPSPPVDFGGEGGGKGEKRYDRGRLVWEHGYVRLQHSSAPGACQRAK